MFAAHSVIEHPFRDSFNRMNTNSLAYGHIPTTMRVSVFATYLTRDSGGAQMHVVMKSK